MSSEEGKVQRRPGAVQRRSAIRSGNRYTYGGNKRQGSVFSETDSTNSGEVFTIGKLTETNPELSKLREKFETLDIAHNKSKKPPPVRPKPEVLPKPSIRQDSGFDDESPEKSEKPFSPETKKLKYKTLPILTIKDTAHVKPPVSPKPPRKEDAQTEWHSKSERSPDYKQDKFSTIQEKLKSTLFVHSPAFAGAQWLSTSAGSLSDSSSGRSSNRSMSSQGSVRSDRDSGTGSSIADIQQRLFSLDIEEEPHLERCNSLEDLPVDKHTSQTVTEKEFQSILESAQYVTVVESFDTATNSCTIAAETVENDEVNESALWGKPDATYSGEASHAQSGSWLHSNTTPGTDSLYSSTVLADSKPYMNTHVKTGLFRVFDTTHSNVSDDSMYVNEDISRNIKSQNSKQTRSVSNQSAMSPVTVGDEVEESVSALDDDIYENVWIPPSKRTPKRKEKMSVKSCSSASSVQSSPNDVFDDACDVICQDIDEDAEDFDEMGDWSDFDSDEGSDFEDEDELRAGDKLYNIVRELTKTEASYVHKIGILVKAKVKAHTIIKNEEVKDMFPYIDSIHKLHEDMLEKFKLRLKTWETNRSIGDLVKVLAPYLKMYTDYVKHFEAAMAFVDKWKARSPEFAKMLNEVVAGSHQGKLDIKTYMLEPIQRVPRYQLLLQQYLKYMPQDDEEEKKEVEAALKAVTDAANYFQFAIKQKDQIYDLIELQKYIDVPIINPNRELKKKGPVNRLAVRTEKICSRYVFLFNDLMLICKEWTVRRIAGSVGYTTLQSLPVDGMEVLDGDHPEYPYTIVVKTRSYVAHFQFDTEEHKLDWLKGFWEVIADRTRNRLQENNRGLSESIEEDSVDLTSKKQVGKEAPVWVHDGDVSMCMLCAIDFSLTRRKHHCRGCGSIVCSKCSSKTLFLEYDKPHKRQRVCDECFLLITDDRRVISNKRYISRERQRKCCVCSGEMKKSINAGKSWEKYWVEVHEGGMVYCFRARLDICAYSSQDMGGCTLELVNFNNQIVFQLGSDESLTLFTVDEKEQMLRWLDGFESAMKDSDAMHFRVDHHQRSFIESTTKKHSRKSTVSVIDPVINTRQSVAEECDSPVKDQSNVPHIKTDNVITDLEKNQSDDWSPHKTKFEINLKTETAEDLSVNNNTHLATDGTCDVAIGTDISDTIESAESRTIGVQVFEHELQPSKKRIQTLIARLYKDANQQTDHNESVHADSDPTVMPQIGRNATMYRKDSVHTGCQTQTFDVHLRSDQLDETSDC